jgi:hypothetical protein
VVGIGLAAPAKEKLLRRSLSLRNDVVSRRLPTFGDRSRLRHDRHHLRREAGKIVPSFLGVDVHELLQRPLGREVSRLGLEVGRSIAAQALGLVRLRVGHSRLEVFVYEQTPDLLVRNLAD